MSNTESRFNAALQTIDSRNAVDPTKEPVPGEDPQPKEWLYGRRMSQCLADFAPDASEALQLAARAQHIERWRIPRSDYPQGRAGYLKWRRDLGRFHADVCGDILRDAGYDEDTIARVQSLLMKRNLRTDPDAQTLEDVICLVFLQYYLADFAAQHPDDKVVSIIAKTWAKMSPRGHEAALAADLPDAVKPLVERALAQSA